MELDAAALHEVRGTALFYPCCGDDLEAPVGLFASVVGGFYFADIRPPRRLRIREVGAIPLRRDPATDVERYRHRASSNEFELHRWTLPGEDAFARLPSLGVFSHRGDTLADGEGSSGVPWLGRAWLTTILARLVRGGFLVTDGSNRPPDGPAELSRFHGNPRIEAQAVREARPFEFAGRLLTCVGYAGDRYGPTLVWRVV